MTLTNGSQSLDRALDLFQRVLEDDGGNSLDDIAAAIGLPVSTAYRLVSRFRARGLLVKVAKGRYRAGTALLDLTHRLDHASLLTQISRPALRHLARTTARTAHLGVLDADMVTYLVKEKGGRQDILTRETLQLEAYCSAIGKVLLAAMDRSRLDDYLLSGQFVPLTPKTITAPEQLRAHLLEVRDRGFAIDDQEVIEGLFCVAVPVRHRDGRIIAAVSSSGTGAREDISMPALLDALRSCAGDIESRLQGAVGPRTLRPSHTTG